MATLSSPGLGSGLDINGIIGKLMQVESQPLLALQKKEAGVTAKISAYGALKGALSGLQSALTALGKESTFTGMSASSSDNTVLSAAASSGAAAGEYAITVTQLAKYHALRSNDPYTSTSDSFTTGTLSIQVGSGSPVNVTIDSSNNTLAGIRDAINAANAGVTASIVFDGSAQRLVLQSKTLGSAGALTVNVSDSGSGGSFALSGLASTNLVQTQAADDAQFAINGLSLTRSSNTITDAIEGVTLTLAKTGTSTVKISRNTAAISAAVSAFVKAYNDAVKQIRDLTAYDAANKKAATLTGDATARSVASQLATMVGASIPGLTGISRLSDLGVAIQRDGTLAFDGGKLDAVLAAGYDVKSFFTRSEVGQEGFAVRAADLLEHLVGNDGLIDIRTEGLNASIKDLQKRQEALQLRLNQIEARYRAQFSALDKLVASMNQTSTYLAQQLANLPKAGGTGN